MLENEISAMKASLKKYPDESRAKIVSGFEYELRGLKNRRGKDWEREYQELKAMIEKQKSNFP